MYIRDRGFTLIELLVVIAIIGLLASVVLASLNTARSKAKDARRQSDLKEIQKGLELYALSNNGAYPSTGGSWRSQCAGWGGYAQDQVAPGLVPTYLPSFSSDPDMNASGNRNCYIYLSNGTNYKLIDDYLTNTDTTQAPGLMDPQRNYGLSRPAGCSGTDPQHSWGVYTPGGMCW